MYKVRITTWQKISCFHTGHFWGKNIYHKIFDVYIVQPSMAIGFNSIQTKLKGMGSYNLVRHYNYIYREYI